LFLFQKFTVFEINQLRMKKSFTKVLVLVFSFLLFPLSIYSQTRSAVLTERFLLKLSVELRGRTIPNECIQKENITVYADGRVIREDCQKTVVKTGYIYRLLFTI